MKNVDTVAESGTTDSADVNSDDGVEAEKPASEQPSAAAEEKENVENAEAEETDKPEDKEQQNEQ